MVLNVWKYGLLIVKITLLAVLNIVGASFSWFLVVATFTKVSKAGSIVFVALVGCFVVCANFL